jgi:hypothetical protein
VAQSCFDICKKGGKVFPHWQTLQYIMPCIVASYVESTTHPERVRSQRDLKNLLSLIHGLLQFFENAFCNWLAGKLVSDPKVNDFHDTLELNTIALYYKDLYNVFNASYIGFETPEGFLGSAEIQDTLFEWPLLVVQKINETNNMFIHPFVKLWYLKAFNFMKDVCDIAKKVWNIPVPGSHICAPELSEMFKTDTIIHALERACSMCYCIKDSKLRLTDHVKAYKKEGMNFKEWRYKLQVKWTKRHST